MCCKSFLSKFAPFVLIFAVGLFLGSFINKSERIVDNGLKENQNFTTEEFIAPTEKVNQENLIENYDNARAKVEELRKQICGPNDLNADDGIFPPRIIDQKADKEFKQK